MQLQCAGLDLPTGMARVEQAGSHLPMTLKLQATDLPETHSPLAQGFCMVRSIFLLCLALSEGACKWFT